MSAIAILGHIIYHAFGIEYKIADKTTCLSAIYRIKRFSFLFLFFFFFDLRSFVFYLFEALDDVLDVGLVCIILDGDGLGLEIGLDRLDALLETDVLLDFLLTVGTVHLWLRCQYDSSDVFTKTDSG